MAAGPRCCRTRSTVAVAHLVSVARIVTRCRGSGWQLSRPLRSGHRPTITRAEGFADHPILTGVELPFTSNVSLYQTQPAAPTATCLPLGTIPDQEPEPVAWTNTYGDCRVFYTSLGHPDDFQAASFRRLLVNAIFWALDRERNT
ncbi:MAG: ThuA domain-containing protein [Sedimentisphaerales bacterium]|nr:ThuA domain-containing protein [Sedimentisphaerales bacterium]